HDRGPRAPGDRAPRLHRQPREHRRHHRQEPHGARAQEAVPGPPLLGSGRGRAHGVPRVGVEELRAGGGRVHRRRPRPGPGGPRSTPGGAPAGARAPAIAHRPLARRPGRVRGDLRDPPGRAHQSQAHQLARDRAGVSHRRGMSPSSRAEEGRSARERLRVLYVASEVAPFAKTGGLADVAGALPQALARLGPDVRVLMPLPPAAPAVAGALRVVVRRLTVPIGDRSVEGALLEGWLGDRVPVYFVAHDGYYDRPALYGAPDDFERYAFFCRSILAAL